MNKSIPNRNSFADLKNKIVKILKIQAEKKKKALEASEPACIISSFYINNQKGKEELIQKINTENFSEQSRQSSINATKNGYSFRSRVSNCLNIKLKPITDNNSSIIKREDDRFNFFIKKSQKSEIDNNEKKSFIKRGISIDSSNAHENASHMNTNGLKSALRKNSKMTINQNLQSILFQSKIINPSQIENKESSQLFANSMLLNNLSSKEKHKTIRFNENRQFVINSKAKMKTEKISRQNLNTFLDDSKNNAQKISQEKTKKVYRIFCCI